MSGKDETGQSPSKVNVSAPDASPEELEELAGRLAAAGLRVDETLPSIGAITGTVRDAATIDALRTIAGARVTVERDRGDFQLPRPDEPIQ